MSSIADSIDRAVKNDTALHYINASDHASALVRNLYGNVQGMYDITEDDPLLYAYMLAERLGKIAGYVMAIQRWCTAVIESTPDQIQETGAQQCR